MPLHRFIEAVDSLTYQEYQKERVKAGLWKRTIPRGPEETAITSRVIPSAGIRGSLDPLSPLLRVDRLKPSHPAKMLCEARKIPNLTRVYHCPKFYAWTNWVLKTEKFSKKALYYDHPRLVIPFLNSEGALTAFQGRDYRPDSDNKYVTILVDEDAPKIFGLDRLVDVGDTYALEGPIDAMFLPNGIAFAGGKHSELSTVRDRDPIVVYDNEPRSSHTHRKIAQAIRDGYRVIIWPKYIVQKDVNDMVLAGLDPKAIIDSRIFSGLEAELELALWRKK